MKFSLIHDSVNDIWKVDFIDEKPKRIDGLNYESELQMRNRKYFVDDNISLCYDMYGYNLGKCFVKEDDTLKMKKLFGEIVSEGYADELVKLYSSQAFKSPTDSIYFFDNDKNMHVFYNDVKNAKGKYFKYRMYTPENPTTLLYEQKIEWK